MAQTLADIKALLAARGLHPKHRFGQNFLHDPRKYDLILRAAEIAADDLVLEVGPGTGALTERLLETGARVVAVEIDRDLEPLLQERLQTYGDQFTLLCADILAGKHEVNPQVMQAISDIGYRISDREKPSDVVENTTPSAYPLSDIRYPIFKLIANLPYNVASPLLINLAMDYPAMRQAVVLVQREVAERLTAAPGSKAYGAMGIMVQAMCEATQVATLPPGCFWPSPQVDSAVVRLVRRVQPLTPDPHRLAKLVHTLFSKRRKQLGAILGREARLPAGVAATARPETLSVPQLVELAGWYNGT